MWGNFGDIQIRVEKLTFGGKKMKTVTVSLFQGGNHVPVYKSAISLPEASAVAVYQHLNIELPALLEASICLRDDIQVRLSETKAASGQFGAPEAKLEAHPGEENARL